MQCTRLALSFFMIDFLPIQAITKWFCIIWAQGNPETKGQPGWDSRGVAPTQSCLEAPIFKLLNLIICMDCVCFQWGSHKYSVTSKWLWPCVQVGTCLKWRHLASLRLGYVCCRKIFAILSLQRNLCNSGWTGGRGEEGRLFFIFEHKNVLISR